MRVLVLGPAGIRKTDYLEEIVAFSDEETIRYDLDRRVKNEVGGLPSYVSLLDNPDKTRHVEILSEKMEEILDSIGEYNPGSPHYFLCLHNVYYRNHNFFSRIDHDLLRKFNPNVILTLIDDFYDMTKRINEMDERIRTESTITFQEALDWRNVVITMADQLSGQLTQGTIPHFVVAIKHDPEIVYRLLFERYRLRLYSAYPMRSTRTYPDRRKELNEYRRELNDRFTVFDPATIDEMPLSKVESVNDERFVSTSNEEIALLKRQSTSFGVEIPDGLRDLSDLISLDDVLELESQIGDSIERRDFRLIGQSHGMTAYRPQWGGGEMSSGVEEEIYHAFYHGKPANWVHKSDEDGPLSSGPFGDRGTTFQSLEEFLEHLDNWQTSRRESYDGPSTWEETSPPSGEI